MKLLVSIDEHYVSNGVHVYSTQGTTSYDLYWKDFLEVFDEVLVLARAREDRAYAGRAEAMASGPNVKFIALPDFQGPVQYVSVRNEVKARVHEAVSQADAYFLRGPGIIGGVLAKELEQAGKKYAAQVIGDPWEVFGAGGVGGPLRSLYRQVLTRELKDICKNVLAVAYVTRATLQQRYPAGPGAVTASWSNVELGEGLCSQQELQSRVSRMAEIGTRKVRLGFIGSLEQPYKGADVLLRALARCRAKGLDVEAEFAGDGRLRGQYERLAAELGISEHARFLGRLGSGKPIFDFLDSIDLFVMPSLTEGLPRAMIEAMARGCPCIGSKVGGIPELLDECDLVPAGNPEVLANKIMEKIGSPQELAASAKRNHAAAQSYMPEHTRAARMRFLEALRVASRRNAENGDAACRVSTHADRNANANDPAHEAPLQGKHLALVVTVPVSTVFFRGQIAKLREAGFRVTFICSPGPQTAQIVAEGGEFIGVPMEREISVFKDAVSLWRLWRVLRRIRPDVTNVGTPKAGLLGGMAARMAGVPQRVYTLLGLRLETTSGPKRWILWLMERIACAHAQHVRCVSASVLDRAVQLRLLNSKNAYVVGAGSANGVDVEYFRRTPERVAEAAELRRKLKIPDGAPVIGFVGRFTRDKGIGELYRAFLRVKKNVPEVRLLLVGRFEEGDPVSAEVRLGLESDPRVLFVGMVSDTPRYYAAMNVLAFPTHREGFGNVSIEAQAAGVPVVTNRVTGAVDSVLGDFTGILVSPRNDVELANALLELLENEKLRKKMGQAGAEWVSDKFRREIVWDALIEDYRRILQKPFTTEDTEGHREKQSAADERRKTQIREERQKGAAGLVKACFDRVGAAGLLVALSPVLAVVALLVRMKLGSPVLFRQERPGKDEKIFELVKFRTMTDERDEAGRLLPDEARLTRLGKWMRSLSLDELPQLWNVLWGELSFVGPRPLLVQYLERYTPEQARRHGVKPGITGWAQVNGRNAISWEEKFALDTWYVDHWSLWVDAKILALTVWRVVRRHGISQEGHATTTEFSPRRHGDTEKSESASV